MTRHFCTLFDRNYLEKGIALHDSLLRHSSEPFKLSILCMDMETFWLLDEMELPHVDLLPIDAFERAMQLDKIREQRTWTEYCWSCASQLCEFLLPQMDADGITYLDSDLFFFSDPAIVFKEIAGGSIAITPHRLIPSKRHLEINGLFNVGWIGFRNTLAGQTCATEWAANCRNRCSARVGCGDQKYLDDFPVKYGPACCVIQNIGVNAGPWSIGNWGVFADGDKVFLDNALLCCYHFHELQEREDGTFRLTNYTLRDEDVRWIYRPYVEAIKAAKVRISEAEALITERHKQMQLQSERA